MKYLNNYSKNQQIALAILSMILLGVGGSAAVDHQSRTAEEQIVEELEHFDQFAYKAEQEVNPFMQSVIKNPTEYNLRTANNRIIMRYESWAKRENGDNKELFQQYLGACGDVVDSMQAGEKSFQTNQKINEMNTLYTKLNPKKK